MRDAMRAAMTVARAAAGVVAAALATASTGSAQSERAPAAVGRRAGAPVTIVDLTHTLTPEFPYIPVPGVTFPFTLEPIATLAKDGVAANRWNIHEHIGTQVDAPSHFAAGG